MLTKKVQLSGLESKSEQSSFEGCIECALVFFDRGKGFLMMHANSVVYSLLYFFSQISLAFSFLFFHFQLTIQISLVLFFFLLLLFPYLCVLFLSYPRSSLGGFPSLPLFSPNIIQFRSSIVSSKPPMSAYNSSGAFSTFITNIIGSTLSYKLVGVVFLLLIPQIHVFMLLDNFYSRLFLRRKLGLTLPRNGLQGPILPLPVCAQTLSPKSKGQYCKLGLYFVPIAKGTFLQLLSQN